MEFSNNWSHMLKQNSNASYFVLACPRDDGSIAILCRSHGSNQGPAICDSKKDAVRLKTVLANDPRGLANDNAMTIIKNLFVYEVKKSIEPVWEKGTLWAYLPNSKAECVESQVFNMQ